MMKPRKSWMLAFVVTGVLSTFGVSAYAASSDEQQIRALEARLVAAFKALDVKRIMECYVPDDTLFAYDVGPPRQFVGREAYTRNWATLLSPFPGPISVEMSDLHVTTNGNLGFGHSIIHFVGTNKDGQTVDLTMRVTDSYRKIKGKWLIVEEHSSVPADLATGRADFASKP